MDNLNTANENIELSLPLNAAYVTAARLTASSIANRLGFGIDEIEDVKAAVSEACIFIIKKSVEKNKAFKIVFSIYDDYLDIRFTSNVNIDVSKPEGELSILMIKAMMDKMEIPQADGEGFVLDMRKVHKVKTFD